MSKRNNSLTIITPCAPGLCNKLPHGCLPGLDFFVCSLNTVLVAYSLHHGQLLFGLPDSPFQVSLFLTLLIYPVIFGFVIWPETLSAYTLDIRVDLVPAIDS